MRLLLLAQVRFLARAPWSALTALFGVALGVASVVAVHLIGAAVTRSLDAAQPPHLAGLAYLLERPALDDAGYFDLRDAWRNGMAGPFDALVPLIEGHLELEGRRVRVLGADWLAYPVPIPGAGSASANVAGGVGTDVRRAAAVPGWRLLEADAVVADRALGYAEGAPIPIDDRVYRVVALVDGAPEPALYADLPVARRLLGMRGAGLAAVGVVREDTLADWRAALERFMPGISAGLPAPAARAVRLPEGFSARSVAAEQPALAFARSILFNLGALGMLALVVAWYLVYQVALIWVERQRPVFARLHAIGAGRGALGLGFGLNFALLGVFATLAGTGLGVVLADLLLRVSAVAPRSVAVRDALDGIVLLKAAGSGLGVCVLGGLCAFARAIRSADRPRARRPVPWRILLCAGAALLLLAGLRFETSGLVGAFGAVLALCLLATVPLNPMLVRLRRQLTRRAGGVGAGAFGEAALMVRLGMREAVWRPDVVAAALAALVLAVATGIGVGLMVESLRADFARMMSQRLAGDFYVSGPAEVIADVGERLAGQPSVGVLAAYGESRVRVAVDRSAAPAGAAAAASASAEAGRGLPALLGYARFDAAESLRYGYEHPLGAGSALVNERLARALDVRAGDRITVAGASLQVVQVHTGFGDVEPRVLVDLATLPLLGMAPVFDRLTVHLVGPGHSPAAAHALVADLAADFPGIEAVARDALRARAFEIFDRTFAMTRALTLLALVVAVVGLYNALTALRLNQASTQYLLEAQGLGSGGRRLLTLVRGGTLGLLAVAAAAPLGICMAWLLCQVINPRAFGWTIALGLPASGWLPPLALGLLAAVFAGLLPAPREQGGFDAAS
ncbi:MAG: ABC transporter permease [Pseudomonadales bacterium]|nr:ABC transporter permease [Pseudomonadales bacterium]